MNWRRFIKRAQADAELRQELESYIEITTEEYIAQGMGADEARQAARRKLGNVTRIQEEVYEMNTATFVETTMRDVRHSVRMLRLNPAFSITAVLALALGIGAMTAMFSVVNGVVIKPLPYPDSDAVVTVGVSAVFGNQRSPNFPLAPRMFASYAENSQSFQEFGLFSPGEATVTGFGSPEHTNTLQVTRGILTTLGVQPALGRWFSRDDDRPGTPETVILSHGYWQRRFGGDPKVIGRVMTIDARPREVIGVMPASFSVRGIPADVILPFRFDPSQPPAGFCCMGIARLKPGASLVEANADVARMVEAWKRVENRPQLEDLQLGPAVRPLKGDVVGDVGRVLWILLGSISILLLIACANVANLLLVRAEGRGQEVAVRTAPGAAWGHIARTLMAESLMLSLAGCLLGLGLAYGGLRVLVANGPANLPRLNEITIDLTVFAFALVTSLVQREILDRLRAIPGVSSAPFVFTLPMTGGLNAIVAAEGKEYGQTGIPPTRNIKVISVCR